MIQLTPQMKIYLSVEPIDFRKGIDGIAQECRIRFKEDPFSGKLFLFTNRGRNSVKILVYDSQGFWLCTKRLSRGKFRWWPQETNTLISAQDVGVLLWNGSPESSQMQMPWRKIE